MSDHKEKDKESKKQRSLSRRAQLRRLHKALETQQLVTKRFIHANRKLAEENKELYRRLCETQKLVPFWVRKFP